MSIKAIETQYAGCRFRSRLEARWAVFFDHLGIRWEYEPQGFKCEYRLTMGEGTFDYLPDFFLPDLQLWAEVKGSLTAAEMTRLADAAAFLSSAGGGGCGHDNEGAHDLVVLGPVPHPYSGRSPARLHMHKGDLGASPWRLESTGCGTKELQYAPFAMDVGGDSVFAEYYVSAELVAKSLLRGYPDRAQPASLNFAYRAARSARFEHGEHG